MATLDDNSVDSVVCDPPYELGFMGKSWDSSGIAYDASVWSEALRVLKPGGHLIAFGSSRTYHRLASAIEDAGFQIRDQIQWLYGTGFPKSMDVSKAIDKAAGAEREVICQRKGQTKTFNVGATQVVGDRNPVTAPATDAAKQWSGWGTALKPAHEPAVLARKPLIGTIAANVLKHGTGALNIDACRVGDPAGRWPANVCHDDSAENRAAFPQDDTGHTARFFYSAKAQTGEREAGLDGLPMYSGGELTGREDGAPGTQNPRAGAGRQSEGRRNMHPTVKPIALMRWCLRLVNPPGGLVLDPFTGSGSTGCAAALEGMRFVGAELDAQHAEIARLRIAYWACEQSPITADQADGAPVQSAMPWGREEVAR
jgi:site-specific DNA-methyltransferase (adenine-specific)